MEEMQNEESYLSEEEAGWQVTDDQAAEWCLGKIREANTEKEKWTAFYMDRLKKIVDREDSRIAFFENKLAIYFGSVPHRETKTQASYQLPSGKLVLKKQTPEIERDDEKLIPWLRENYEGDYVKVKETVDWATLKKAFASDDLIGVHGNHFITDDGEIIPGITVTERPDKFVVEVK